MPSFVVGYLWTLHRAVKQTNVGIHLADVLEAAILLPRDFQPKVLGVFFRFPGKGERRAEVCSDPCSRSLCLGCPDTGFRPHPLRTQVSSTESGFTTFRFQDMMQ